MAWEVRPSASVSQNADRAEVIERIRAYFGCGSVRPDPSDSTVKWESRSLGDLAGAVLPHFRKYPMLSGKQADFERLDEICHVMARGQHLEPRGLAAIVELAREMNPSGRRRYAPEQILRDLNKMKA